VTSFSRCKVKTLLLVYCDVQVCYGTAEVRKGTPRNTKNENERHKIFNMVLHMNWDYVSGKKK
jgi:hypothetical protein